MDVNIILTTMGTALAIIGANVALISWLRADMKAFEAEVRAWREQFSRDTDSYRREVQQEMKDFHGRLCAIEERHRG